MDEATARVFMAQIQDNPLDKTTAAVFADWMEENGGDLRRVEQLRKGLIPLTREDEIAVQVLGYCNFAPATFDKKFTSDLCARREKMRKNREPVAVTPKQYIWLWVLLWRYRRSVKPERFIEEAERRYNRYARLLDLPRFKPIKVRPKPSDEQPLFEGSKQ